MYDDLDETNDLVTVKSGGTNRYDDEGVCGTAPLKVCAMGVWYEIRHFFRTLWKHPVIILVSLAVFGLVCGLGMWAVQSEREAYVKDKMDTAKFVVSIYLTPSGVLLLFFALKMSFSHSHTMSLNPQGTRDSRLLCQRIPSFHGPTLRPSRGHSILWILRCPPRCYWELPHQSPSGECGNIGWGNDPT